MHQALSAGRYAPGVISRQVCTRCYLKPGGHQVLSPGRDAPGVISRQVCAVRAHLKNRARETEMESTPTLQKNLQLVKVAGALFLTDQPRTPPTPTPNPSYTNPEPLLHKPRTPPTHSHIGLQLCMYYLNRKNSHEKAKGQGETTK